MTPKRRNQCARVVTAHQIFTGLCAVVCVLACVSCDRTEPQVAVIVRPSVGLRVDEIVTSLEDASLETEADVERAVANASASERAVIFVHVDWAPMLQQQRRFAEFMLAYQQKHPTDPLMFHYVDCTPVTDGYAPLRSLPGWRELQEAAGVSLIHGHGEMVWLKRGRVLRVEPILNFNSAAALVRKTETLMTMQDGG